MSKYLDAMHRLNDAAYDAVREALKQPGAPVEALQEMAADIDHLIDHKCTRRHFELAETLKKIEYWFDTDPHVLAGMSAHERADHDRQHAMIRAALAKAEGKA